MLVRKSVALPRTKQDFQFQVSDYSTESRHEPQGLLTLPLIPSNRKYILGIGLPVVNTEVGIHCKCWPFSLSEPNLPLQ